MKYYIKLFWCTKMQSSNAKQTLSLYTSHFILNFPINSSEISRSNKLSQQIVYFNLAAIFDRCFLYDRIMSTVTRSYIGKWSCFISCLYRETANSHDAWLLWRWNTPHTLLVVLGFRHSLWQYFYQQARSAQVYFQVLANV